MTEKGDKKKKSLPAKKNSKGAFTGNNRVGKKKLNFKNKRPAKPKGKFVKVDSLRWKPVEIPDAMDDVGGLYGFEEIDGVGVDIVDGQVKFHTNNEDNVVKSDQESAPEGQEEDDEEKEDNDEDMENAKDEEGGAGKEKKNAAKQKNKQTQSDPQLSSTNFSKLQGFEDIEDEEDIPEVWNMILSVPIRKAIQKLGFKEPTEIQTQSIPKVINGDDVIGKAATGSGKTIAYGIPIIERHLQAILQDGEKEWPTGIIFGPTRELVNQISKHLAQIGQFCNFGENSGVIPITGGLSTQKQTRLLDKKPAIIVATPGRFLELITLNPKHLEMVKKSEMLVLDEADRLIQEGHFQDLEKTLDMIGRGKKQTMVYSATFSKDLMYNLERKQNKQKKNGKNDDTVELLKKKLGFRNEPAFIDSNPAETIAAKVVESVLECGALEKDLYLSYFLIAYPGRTMVFTNSIGTTKRLAQLLQELNINTHKIYSGMEQKQRLKALEKFRDDKEGVLIATDVAARGLDIPSVQHVVHYHVPKSADLYVHRSGRTARAGLDGVSVVLCSPDEVAPFTKLRQKVKSDIQLFEPDYDIIRELTPRVKIAQRLIESQRAESRKKGDQVDALAKEAGLVSDNDDDDNENVRTKQSQKEHALSKNEKKHLRAELKELLSKPIGRVSKYLTSSSSSRNIAHMTVSGSSHEKFIGKEKNSALDKLKK